jgi:hypothetical protein
MQAHFQYRLTKDEYVTGLGALMAQLGREDTNRIPRLFEQLAIVLVILAVVAIAFPEAFMGLLVAMVLLAISQELLWPRWRRGATGTSYDPAVADHDIEFTHGAIVSRSALRQRQWTWPAVRRIHDLQQAIVLELVGWDMIVLPNHLWNDSDARRPFLDDIRALATEALSVAPARRPMMVDTHDLLTVGALGATVDTLFVLVHALPVHRGPGPAIGDLAFLGTFAAVLLLGLALAYGVYRVAKIGLATLHNTMPRAASAIAYLLVWALPIYMLSDYFRWL